MEETSSNMLASILEKLRSADDLPSLPAVAVQVLHLVRSDTASVAEIAKVIEHDPALASKILKVANSSLFGMRRQISSLHQAMVVLGLRTVKVMALTFSLVDSNHRHEAGGFDYQLFWRRSLTGAVAARLIGRYVKGRYAEEAFMAALLSDIGMLAAYRVDREAYEEVLARCESTQQSLQTVEQEVLGATHELFSKTLLDAWGLPEDMVDAIGRHHCDPDVIIETDPEPGSLLRCLAAAVMVGDLFCSPGGAAHLREVTTHVPKLLAISAADLQQMLNELHKQVQETALTWSIDIGRTRSYKDIQAEAVVQLAKLTMAAELERAQLAAREEELHTENRTLARKATTDGLTGISNRIALEDHLETVFKTAIPQGRSVGMLLLDIDRFKKLNDTFGHQAGDTALRLVGNHLRSLCDERRFTARYGGEEFAIVVLDAPLNELRNLAEQVRLGIQGIRVAHQTRNIAITVSIGGAVVDRSCAEATPAGLITRADKCLYYAKQTGRNRAVCGQAEHGVLAVAR